jgi:hypothetical protein
METTTEKPHVSVSSNGDVVAFGATHALAESYLRLATALTLCGCVAISVVGYKDLLRDCLRNVVILSVKPVVKI